ncbi:MAG: hypothetical protein GXO63_00525 [Candidatus Micrarchaeota archaeon]|nr:hypothetical protein [Candidatus Micrarchaeota archaeon]
MGKKEALDRILKELNETSPDIKASLIARVDGLLIHSRLVHGMDGRSLAAMTATIVGTAQTISKEIEQGKLKQVIVDSENGKLISINVGKIAILSCLVSPSANLGLVLLEMSKAAEKIKKEIE